MVHDALDTTSMLFGSYLSSLTPMTNMGASAEGAEMITFFAPPLMCAAACSLQQCDQGRGTPRLMPCTLAR